MSEPTTCLVYQCDASSIIPKGIPKQLIDLYDWADIYKQREYKQGPNLTGSIVFSKKTKLNLIIVHMITMYKFRHPNTKGWFDSVDARIGWFTSCIESLKQFLASQSDQIILKFIDYKSDKYFSPIWNACKSQISDIIMDSDIENVIGGRILSIKSITQNR